MTTQEAITYMQLYKFRLQGSLGDLHNDIEAFDTAINAMKGIDALKAEIKSLRGTFPNEYYLKLIDKHLKRG